MLTRPRIAVVALVIAAVCLAVVGAGYAVSNATKSATAPADPAAVAPATGHDGCPMSGKSGTEASGGCCSGSDEKHAPKAGQHEGKCPMLSAGGHH